MKKETVLYWLMGVSALTFFLNGIVYKDYVWQFVSLVLSVYCLMLICTTPDKILSEEI